MRRAAVLGLAVGLLALAPLTVTATERLGQSPHGQPEGCPACHLTDESGSLGAPRPVLATCRTCHPDADMHPVGMRPEHIAVAEGFPLEDGVVTCATCHAEPGCDADRDGTRPWLRGGTPARKADFCFRCHESQAMKRQSPHLAFGATDPAEAGCPACHATRPAVGARLADAGLRLAPEEACATCHPGPSHAGAAEHVGRTQGPLSGPAAGALPLGPGGVIGCWTCHDVHVVPDPAPVPGALALALSAAPRREGAVALLALPASDGSLCRACHGDGP